MARRLIKIAKELNVATSTIVEYLSKSGFDIENKPTAKISDDMYDELLKEFSNSMAEKVQADSLIIGSRIPQEEERKVPVETTTVSTPIRLMQQEIPTLSTTHFITQNTQPSLLLDIFMVSWHTISQAMLRTTSCQ